MYRIALYITLCLIFLPFAVLAEEVNVYSAQQEHLIRPILKEFEQDTGITVNIITGDKAQLITRLEQEGEFTPADLLLTVDIGNIWQANDKGLLQPIESEVLQEQIPEYLRGDEGYWYGLTTRARIIFYRPEDTDPSELSTYEALADAKWDNGILIRSSGNIYNQSLLASIIGHKGEDAARAWAEGVVENFARTPQGGDRDQLRALAAGEGKLAVSNTYYYGLLQNSENPQDRDYAEKIKPFFPNQDGRGTHVNIRGGGITKHAKNKDNAVKLLEYLASDKGQQFFAESNYEYPANPDVELPKTVASWGDFKRDTMNLEEIGRLNAKAVRIFNEVGWP